MSLRKPPIFPIFCGLLFAVMTVWALVTPHGWEVLAVFLALIGGLCMLALITWMGPAHILSVGLALTLLSGHWGDIGSPIPLDRLFMGLGIAAIMVDPEMRRVAICRLRQPIGLLLAVLVGYAAVSAWQAGTLTTSLGGFGLLDNLGLVPFVVYVVTPAAFRTSQDRDVLLTTLLLVGAYLGLTALFETLELNSLIIPHYISNPAIGVHFGRARGPFVEAVADGLAMYSCGVASAMAMYYWRGQKGAIVAAVVAVLCAAGAAFTLTRAIWLAAVIATLPTLALFRQTRRFVVPAVVTGLLVAVATIGLVPGFGGKVDERQSSLGPVWDRLNTDAAAVRMVEARPLFGFGWGSFEVEGVNYLRQAGRYPLTGAGLDVHNVFLARLAELGIIGTLLWLVALCAAVYEGACREGPQSMLPWRIGFVAIVLSWVIVAIFAPLTYPFSNVLLWLWAGILSPAAAIRVKESRGFDEGHRAPAPAYRT